VEPFTYKTIHKTGKSVYADRGSRFLGFSFSIDNKEQFKERLEAIMDLHPKASHFCYAYRVDHDGLIWRCSDNGEPAGVAGKPLLGQLDSAGLSAAAVVVVRYFGGTLLGVPGLIQAYKTTAKLSIENATLVEKPILKVGWIHYDYTQEHTIQRYIHQFQISILAVEQGLFPKMKLGIPLHSFKVALRSMTTARASLQWEEEV